MSQTITEDRVWHRFDDEWADFPADGDRFLVRGKELPETLVRATRHPKEYGGGVFYGIEDNDALDNADIDEWAPAPSY